MLIMSIFDSKSKNFSLPFFQINTETAIRAFRDIVNDPTTTINKYPDDFTMFELGTFDETVGKIMGHDTPQVICNALEHHIPTEQAA
jgi:hypothetical protein